MRGRCGSSLFGEQMLNDTLSTPAMGAADKHVPAAAAARPRVAEGRAPPDGQHPASQPLLRFLCCHCSLSSSCCCCCCCCSTASHAAALQTACAGGSSRCAISPAYPLSRTGVDVQPIQRGSGRPGTPLTPRPQLRPQPVRGRRRGGAAAGPACRLAVPSMACCCCCCCCSCCACTCCMAALSFGTSAGQ